LIDRKDINYYIYYSNYYEHGYIKLSQMRFKTVISGRDNNIEEFSRIQSSVYKNRVKVKLIPVAFK